MFVLSSIVHLLLYDTYKSLYWEFGAIWNAKKEFILVNFIRVCAYTDLQYILESVFFLWEQLL
jgi:hypothetical protein